MATEDLTTYSIYPDPLVYTTVTAAKSSVVDLPRNVDEYVYDDKGVDHFNDDFEHLIDVYLDAADQYGQCIVWGIANVVDDHKGIDAANGDELAVWLNNTDAGYGIRLVELVGGTMYRDDYIISLDTTYYLKIKRDESVGDYGTLYCYIYSDAARTNLLDTLELALHEKEDFRYIYATQTRNTNDSYGITGYCENLDLQELTEKTGSDILKTTETKVDYPEAALSKSDILKIIEAKIEYPAVALSKSDIFKTAETSLSEAAISKLDSVSMLDEKLALMVSLQKFDLLSFVEALGDRQFLLPDILQLFDAVAPMAKEAYDALVLGDYSKALVALSLTYELIQTSDVAIKLEAFRGTYEAIDITDITTLETLLSTFDISKFSDYQLLEAIVSSSDLAKLADVAILRVLREVFDAIVISDTFLSKVLSTLDTLTFLSNVVSYTATLEGYDAAEFTEAISEKIREGIRTLLRLLIGEKSHILIYYSHMGTLLLEEAAFQRAETICIKAHYRESGDLADPSVSMTITIYNGMRVKVVDGAAMDRDSIGKYHYDYTPAANAILGEYKVEVVADMGGGETTTETSTFEMEA